MPGPPTDAPPAAQLMQLTTGKWISMAISAAAELGVADALAGGARTAVEVAEEIGAEAGPLYRLMRALTVPGLLAEDDGGRFALTPLGEPLRSDARPSLRGWARLVGHELTWKPWGALAETVRTGRSGMAITHSDDMFAWLAEHPEMLDVFQGGMTAVTTLVAAAAVEAYDFGRYRHLVDVGGGHGLMLGMALAGAPETRGTLFDLPEVVAGAGPTLARFGVQDRVTCVGGSFFESVPAGGDAYLLKAILHDWSDDDALRILGRIREAMAPDARILLVEMVIPGPEEPDLSKLLDLEMLVQTEGGRERTAEQWRNLLTRAGLRLEGATPTRAAHVLEAVRA